jgi:hypothetical protein
VQCFHCQKFVHTQQQSVSNVVCGVHDKPGHGESLCHYPPHCVNYSRAHTSIDKLPCFPGWKGHLETLGHGWSFVSGCLKEVSWKQTKDWDSFICISFLLSAMYWCHNTLYFYQTKGISHCCPELQYAFNLSFPPRLKMYQPLLHQVPRNALVSHLYFWCRTVPKFSLKVPNQKPCQCWPHSGTREKLYNPVTVPNWSRVSSDSLTHRQITQTFQKVNTEGHWSDLLRCQRLFLFNTCCFFFWASFWICFSGTSVASDTASWHAGLNLVLCSSHHLSSRDPSASLLCI